MDDVKSRILAAAMGMMQPFGGLLAFFTIDSLGRRPLMTWSAGAMAICMAILAGTTSPSQPHDAVAPRPRVRSNAIRLLCAPSRPFNKSDFDPQSTVMKSDSEDACALLLCDVNRASVDTTD